jgi:hypothetical protein
LKQENILRLKQEEIAVARLEEKVFYIFVFFLFHQIKIEKEKEVENLKKKVAEEEGKNSF